MKVVINDCYGGFSLSNFAYKELFRRKGKECYFYNWEFEKGYFRIDDDPDKYFMVVVSTKDYGRFAKEIYDEDRVYYRGGEIRTDSDLITMIEEFGSKKCSWKCSKLIIKDIPSGAYYRISEYDGLEWIEYRDEIEWLIAE